MIGRIPRSVFRVHPLQPLHLAITSRINSGGAFGTSIALHLRIYNGAASVAVCAASPQSARACEKQYLSPAAR